ncbi:ATP-binding protein [Albibacterium sp.]|uniref:ATP-binding protein n=1 Tax=Albibacterium sp. TaxID=2952885 RepID=UPI002C9869AF|nr:ATP-binding protein [Albibacterium sp.]HUH19375.1 ATP-binding protein [Albibacterium sp.]
MTGKINPFKHDYFIGYISQVLPQFVKIHFPSSVLLNSFTHYGEEYNGGLVGSFVVIEGDRYGFLGRLVELSLPESERLSLNEKAFQTNNFHPSGKIEILLSFDLYNPFNVKKGLSSYPNIGAKVYVSSGELVQKYMERFGVKPEEEVNTITIGKLVSDANAAVKINMQALFGRHCAIVGTTGGGKSFTVAKLTESLIGSGNKVILIDATGEYEGFDALKETCVSKLVDNSILHYTNLSIADLFVMFRPSGQVQQPTLLEAIKSLRLVSILKRDKDNFDVTVDGNTATFSFEGKGGSTLHLEVTNGCLVKLGKTTSAYNRLCALYAKELEDPFSIVFDISKLTTQLNNECLYLNGTSWGANINQSIQGNISSLILRIHNTLNDDDFKSLFGFDNIPKTDVSDKINSFIKDQKENKKLLRIAFDKVPFSFQVREIIANSIGSLLLKKAREGEFNSKNKAGNAPIVLIIDEAHQFLNKSVKDEYFENTKLDSFDSIAKECRKHGLFLCIATQMPRDIPAGTLSQMGTFIVHRLINHFDKEAIANACSSANRNTLDFLPILGEGEAILTGVDFAMPIIMKMDKPKNEPNSHTPKLN